jgi:hypothetical protein
MRSRKTILLRNRRHNPPAYRAHESVTGFILLRIRWRICIVHDGSAAATVLFSLPVRCLRTSTIGYNRSGGFSVAKSEPTIRAKVFTWGSV